MNKIKQKNIFISTAIDYANASPHIGHALEKVQADTLARFYRQQGKNVFFLTGTDEHGSKVAKTAEKKNMPVMDFVDQNVAKFKELLKIYNISNDYFIRTTDKKKHWPAVVKMWNKILKAGDLNKDSYEGLYCVGCEAFLTEKDLINGKCPNHNKEPEVLREENYFFKISKYTNKLIELIESEKMEVLPQSRRNEILNILKSGYSDVSFSRSVEKLNWGIPVPNDDSQVIYVWGDALINYISALGFADDNGTFKKFWQDAYVTHIVGKDILKFHAAIWPAMLLSAEVKLPDRIFSHGFITSEGKKMSKSLGNVVDPFEIVEMYGTDSVRYYLLKEIPADNDGDFSHARFKEVYTSDLANGLGNLVSRTTNMIANYLDGKIELNSSSEFDLLKISEFIEDLKFDKALSETWTIIDQANKMIDDVKPWKLAKSDKMEDKEKIKDLLNYTGTVIRDIAEILIPFIPQTAEKILQIITADKIKKSEPLFPRLD